MTTLALKGRLRRPARVPRPASRVPAKDGLAPTIRARSARASRLAAALATAMVVWVGGARVASGHALILESMPQPDAAVPASFASVVLRFNSRIEPALSRLSLVGPNGRRLPLRGIRSDAPDRLIAPIPALTPGAYTLEWQVLSADGHITRGSFPFRVVPAP